MQVQHEACLIEPSPPNFAEHPNKSLDSYCLLAQLSNSLSPIEQIATCASGNASLLAVHLNANNQIVILDTQSHQRRDKFPLKAYDKKFSRQSFHVSGLAFSPDGQRLAVGQTDCIIYIYKLALGGQQAPASQSGGSDVSATSGPAVAKTTISGKFASASPVTCLVWSELGLVFGGQDGKVRLILSFNKPPPPPQSVAVAASDPNSRTSGQTQEQKQQPKVVTLFAGGKGDATPICLAYKAPVLLVGLSNCTIQVLVISTIAGPADGEQVGGDSIANLSGDLMSLLPPPPPPSSSSRRNSSSTGSSSSSSSHAPAVVQSHTIEHSCPPVHLNLIHLQHALQVCCSGSDGKLAFHCLKFKLASGGGWKGLAVDSQLEQTMDLKEDILAMDYSHINEILALATRSRLMFVRYDQQQQQQQHTTDNAADSRGEASSSPAQAWRLQASTIELRRVLALTGIRWTRDGAQLALGCSSGSLELFKCQWSKQSMNDQMDICHIARNRIRITDRERNLLATYKTLYDIKRVNLLDGGQSVLVWTSNSLLLAKLGGPQSEINWPAGGGGGGSGGGVGSRRNSLARRSSIGAGAAATTTGSKFLFDRNSDYVIIYHEASCELHLLRLGQESVRVTVQLPANLGTTTVKRRLLSVCQFPPSSATGGQNVRKLSSSSPNRATTTGRGSNLASTSSSRQSSAAQLQPRNSISGGLAQDASYVNALQLSEETGEQVVSEQVVAPNQVERFAYLSSRCQLEIIDLSARGSNNQVIYTHRHAHQIEWLAFGHTGRLLAFLDASGQLNLLRIKQQQQMADDNLLPAFRPDPNRTQTDMTGSHDAEYELEVLLTNCDSTVVLWLPESDSLVAQAGAIVYVWHDLYDCGSQVVEKFDTRNYNFMRKPALIDLSLRAGARGEVQYPKIEALIRDQEGEELAIELSNKQRIQLDKISSQFYAKLASGSLESALDLLESFDGRSHQRRRRRLYAKLGWMAIERAQCELAGIVFKKLQYKSLANYIEECLKVAKTEADTATGGGHRVKLMLAKLSGNWNQFERLLAHDHQDEVIATYRRLNKWARLVEFLGRKQQFRQRDLAERDQITWLIGRNRLREAAELEASSSGDLAGALELLLGSHRRGPHEACEFALSNKQKLSLALVDGRPRVRELLETEICDKLVASGDPVDVCKAAELCDKILGDFRRALDLYLEAGDFESALQVVAKRGELSNRADEIHLLCADNLRAKFLADRFQTSGKRARAAIDHYLGCNQVARALEMANLLHGANGRGYEILVEHWDELMGLKLDDSNSDQEQRNMILAQCNELARQLLGAGKHAEAARALEMAENYERLIELLIGQGELERAFEVSLEHVHAGDRQATSARFIELAGSYVTEADKDTRLAERAERIYLLVDRAELAIEMHEKLGHYDRMLELIERHQSADQLEASLLQLARSLELAGQLQEAEKYLLRASPGEWTSVVRMYRLARRWPDAFRVARASCLSEHDPLLVQLAYWWAKSLIPVAPSGGGGVQDQSAESFARARNLLHELELFKQVIEFACEAKNFQFALDVCGDDHSADNSLPQSDKVKRELVLRYATFLEQQHKFDEAEKLLLDHNLIELAAKMHMDNDQHSDAIRVIERQLELATSGGGGGAGGAEPEVDKQQQRRQQLTLLLNSTLIECAQRIVSDLRAVSRRTGIAGGGDLHGGEKLQMAQQMFLRAQRPELAIEMYQSLEMWREAIQVAQRFAPRLLEGVERALDQQVQADIEPILRQTQTGSMAGGAPTEAASSSGGDTESLGGSSAASAGDQPMRPVPVAADARNNSTTRATPVRGAKASALGVWRQFEFAYRQDDRRGARLHFDKYLSLLLVQVESCLTTGSAKTASGQVARQLRHLDKFLRACRLHARADQSIDATETARANLIGSILRQRDTLNKLNSLAELVCMLDTSWCSMDLSCAAQAHATWSSLRNILADCTHLLAIAGPPEDVEGAQPVRACLLATHYVTLYVSLVRHLSQTQSLERLSIKQVELMAAAAAAASGRELESPARDLLSKLSFALLRHTHLLDLTRVLHLAGLWQLASGHLALARGLWSALLEWHDSRGGSAPHVNGNRARVDATTTRLPAPAVLGQFVTNLPDNFTVFSPVANLESINHIRHWLLETLIGTTSGKTAACMPPAWAHLDANSLACLACGLPVEASALHLSAQVALRAHEFEALLNLCGDAQSDPDGGDSVSTPLTSRLKGAIERRRRRLKNADGTQDAPSLPRSSTSAATDQLSEVVDFIIDLSETLDSSGAKKP